MLRGNHANTSLSKKLIKVKLCSGDLQTIERPRPLPAPDYATV
jgi:hypothetical protein